MDDKKKYTALIVDDSEMNREILKEILSDELNIIELDNGNDACEYMMNHTNDVGIVILDLIMPGMDGFEVLRFMKYKHLMDLLPVIMISADSDGSNIEKAFDLGVIDFLPRPFSERIVLRRVMTTIRLFKRQKELIDNLDRQFKADDMRIDDLTGLDYKQTFFNKVYTHLKGDPFGKFVMIAIDVDHFKLFNNYYGWEEGDRYLQVLAKYLKEFTQRHGGIAGYLGGDDFAVFVPQRQKDLLAFVERVWKDSELSKYEVGFLPKLGYYEISDNSESIGTIYDNAKIAVESIKDDYTKRIAQYDDSMFANVRNEYELLVDVNRGALNDEFTFFIQPKVNMNTGKIVGGEALVRWEHKEKGLVSPGVFLPVLEKNGFISNIDRIVWDKVAAWLRKRLDEGHRPVPVSVNVSRADIFTMNVTETLKQILEKYKLPSWLIEVEITESAYVEEDEKIKEELDRLRASSFTVLMDDFGSGYSSLNTLKDMSIDILKIDMKFLHMDISNINKGVSILESVVNMARSLRIPTIVEGVETKEQVDFLTGMGCSYAQGFHFYRPMPVYEFERLLSEEEKVDFDGIYISNLEPVHVREFLDENLFSDVVVNNILGPVAFYEVDSDDQIRLIRMNEQYCRLLGRKTVPEKDDSLLIKSEEIETERYGSLSALFAAAEESPLVGAEDRVRVVKQDGEETLLNMRLFFLRERFGVRVFYGSLKQP